MKPAISLHNTTLKLGAKTIWKQLQLTVEPGEFIAVLGPNGAGKSSLLKSMLGLTALASGSVTINGSVGYIPQQKAFDRDVPMTGRDLVTFGVNGARWFVTPTSAAEQKRIATAIHEVGAAHYANKPIGQLSGGEQQRLRIAQAIVNNPDILLCDEPLLSLDAASQQTVGQLLHQRAQQGAAVVFVTHEINPVLPFVNRVLYLAAGKWTIGKPSEVLTSEHLTNLYGVPVEVLRVHGRIIVISAGDQHHVEEHV